MSLNLDSIIAKKRKSSSIEEVVSSREENSATDQAMQASSAASKPSDEGKKSTGGSSSSDSNTTISKSIDKPMFLFDSSSDPSAESIVTMNKTMMIPLAVGLGIYADIEAATALNANTLKIELLRLCGKVDSITIDDKTMPPTVKVNHFIKQSFAEPAQVPQA
jgi:hypothetical protein